VEKGKKEKCYSVKDINPLSFPKYTQNMDANQGFHCLLLIGMNAIGWRDDRRFSIDSHTYMLKYIGIYIFARKQKKPPGITSLRLYNLTSSFI